MSDRYVLNREDFARLIHGDVLLRGGARIYLAGDLRLDDLAADITAELASRQRVADRLAEIALEMEHDVSRSAGALQAERGYAPPEHALEG